MNRSVKTFAIRCSAVEERPFPGRVPRRFQADAALKAPLFHVSLAFLLQIKILGDFFAVIAKLPRFRVMVGIQKGEHYAVHMACLGA
jgi:hypothetical protein